MADIEVEGSDLTAIISDEIRQAQTIDQTKRARAIEYMRGEMNDLPARPNGSTQTSRDVADAISWVLPQIVRVFTASDKMVEFEATKEGGEEAAEEASDYTNYSFFRENNGYALLYNATHDGLLMGNGAVCSYWCPEESKTKIFRDKTDQEIAALLDEGWEPTGVVKPGKPTKVTLEDMSEAEVPTVTVKLQKITERGQIKDETLKPENLLVNLGAVSLGERFTAYLHDDKTRSDLMTMADEYGWDTDVIENLPRYSQQTSNQVQQARDNSRPGLNDNAAVKSGDIIDLYHCFIRVDRDGDGIAELLRVWYAGNAGSGAILGDPEEWEDDVPFTDIPCYPVPHQWQAEGLYDRLADVARVKTTLLRAMLDNSYAVGLPMREVEEGSVLNPDILISPKFGGLIWKKKGSAPVINYETDFIGDKLLLGLNYMDEVITKRTGISRQTMALDPEQLQNQTATASQNQRDAQVTQSELIARNMAELGWSRFFAKRRNLAKKYIKGAILVPSKNGDPQLDMQGQPAVGQDGKPLPPKEYRTMQPEQWGDDMACTINVGLGTGSRDRDMAMLNTVQMGQIGMAERLGQLPSPTAKKKASEFIPKILRTAQQIAESSGLKNPDAYYPKVTDEDLAQIQQEMEQAAQQPDPALALEKTKQEGAQALEEKRGQTQTQLKQVDAQLGAHEAELKAQGEIVKNKAELDADLQTKAADRENAIALEQIKQQSALQIESMRIASAERIKAAELTHQAELEQARLANAQPSRP